MQCNECPNKWYLEFFHLPCTLIPDFRSNKPLDFLVKKNKLPLSTMLKWLTFTDNWQKRKKRKTRSHLFWQQSWRTLRKIARVMAELLPQKRSKKSKNTTRRMTELLSEEYLLEYTSLCKDFIIVNRAITRNWRG